MKTLALTKTAVLCALLMSMAACSGGDPKPGDAPATEPGAPASAATPASAAAPASVALEPTTPAKPRALVAWTGATSGAWDAVETLEGERKYAAAIEKVGEILAAAQASKNSEEIVRAIIKTVQLRIGLHGYETAVRFLDEVQWPTDLLGDTTLRLFYAQSIATYVQAYGWEVRKREKVVSKGPVDLKKWTAEQLHAHANAQFHAAWRQREGLGEQSVNVLDAYLAPNTFPRAIRATLRDAVTYLWTQTLANSSAWRPEHASQTHRLDLSMLLAETVAVPALDDLTVHPLHKLVGLLAELEGWHREAGRAEAAFEARRRRLVFLHDALTDTDDRARIRASLTAQTETVKATAWWAMGMATLAEMTRTADDLVAAHRIVGECVKASPTSIGGRRCLSIKEGIERPAFALDGMAVDAPKRRSVGVMHKNLETLYLRAYRFDLESQVAGQKDYNLLPGARAVETFIDRRNPIAEWSVKLPATTDFKMHRTWITPPITGKGSYIIAATPNAEFAREAAPMQVIVVTLSDLVITHHSQDGKMHVQAFDGPSGAPVAGATLRLYRHDWRNGHRLLRTVKTDAGGVATLTGAKYQSHFLIARKGEDVTLNSGNMYFRKDPKPRPRSEVLVYTDRSVYRPGQPLHWQTVAWTGMMDAAVLKVDPKKALRVELRDGNNEVVATQSVTTNGFGSAAGQFTIPTGRALGRWRITTQHAVRGGQVRVEEYKRPTFEAELNAPVDQLRLNEPATLTGEARYYFGLPVTAGKAEYRIVRRPIYPWWWSYWWRGASIQGEEVVGTGAAALDEAGKFVIAFTPKADERLAKGKARAVTYAYAISAEVTDEGGETRTASRTIRLGFVAVQANIASEVEFLTAQTPAPITISRLTLDGEPAPGKGSWRLLALKSPAKALAPAEMPTMAPEGGLSTPGDLQRPRWSHGYDANRALMQLADGAVVAQGDSTHDAKGKAEIELAGLEPGAYRMRYTTTDAFGAQYETEKTFVVAGAQLPVATAFDFRVERSRVKVGEPVRVLVHSGLPNQTLVLERWRSGERIERRVLTAGVDPAVIELAVTDADRGGIGLSLQAVHDHQHVRLTRSVHVPWDDRVIDVSFETFRDLLRPGQSKTWTLKVKSPRPGMATEVLAYMYDKSLDIFGPHSPPSPMSLLPWRGSTLSVNTSLSAARRVGVRGGQFATIAPYPSLRHDRLKFLDGYGIGGPGGGGFGKGRRRMARGEMALPMAAAPAPDDSFADADAPARELEEKLGGMRKDEAEATAAAETPEESAVAAAEQPTTLRSNFSETAFFQPQLTTGPDGTVSITFEVPDSVTAWNVWVHAISKDLSYGKLHKEVRTVKDLMVRPYLPRFLREADKAQLEVVVNNAGDVPLSGELVFDIIDPETEESVADQFGLSADQRTVKFSAEAGKSDRARFSVTAPSKLIPVAFKVTASAGDLKDGELRPLPVLPGRVHLAQSRFTTLKGPVKKTLHFADLAKDDDATRIDEQLVVTLDAQLFYGVLSALPYLINYPYECAEQTLNRFVSTGILSSLYDDYPGVAKMAKKMSARDTATEAWDAPDPNRKLALEETPWLQQSRGGPEKNFEKVLDPRIANAQRKASLARLRKMQTSIGAFPWWSGGRPSPYMTLYMLHGFSKATEFGVDVPKRMVQRAWRYMKRHYLDRHLKEYIADDCCWEFITTINYVLSNFPDASWSGGVISEAERKTMADFSFKHWKAHSPLLKGYLALTLHRMDREADAKLVWDSVLDSAKEAPDEGTFWAAEDRSWLWYNDRIETHAFALKTTMEIQPKWAKIEGLVLWLFVNKKLNHWKSTRATAEVIYSLASYLKKTGQLGIREETEVVIGDRKKTFVFEPDEFTGKKNQIVVAGADIIPKVDSTITVENKTQGFQMASATWHFSTEKMPDEARGDFLGVTRTYFRRDKKGREVTLVPLKEGAAVALGDEVEVHLSLTSKHALEYVHLRDPRAAGYEPTSLRSEHKYDLGVRWFEEVRDSATNFFFEALPKGEYTFKYRLRATTAGTFKVGPATVQPMYAPEFNAYSAGHVLGVKSAAP